MARAPVTSSRYFEPRPSPLRQWWAQLVGAPGGRTLLTRINIELTIHKNQVEELMNVKGIGEKSFLKLKPLITVAADRADRSGGQK